MNADTLLKKLSGRPALICLQAMEDMPDDCEGPEYQVQDGIAIIPICGLLDEDEYAEIAANVAKAAMDSSVRGVILHVNSPGGYTDGVFECGAEIAKAAAQKPCYAVAAPIAYSAAYWLASQANRIYVPPVSGGVGSIGVYCAHLDMSGMLAQMGLAVTLISAGKGKTDGNPYEPLSAEAKKKLQSDVSRIYGEFVGAVSRGRGMSPQDVIALGAELCDGSARAIAAGLADEQGDDSDAWVDMLSALNRSSAPSMPKMPMAQSSSAASAAENSKQEAPMPENTPGTAEAKVPTAEEIQAQIDKARTEGTAEAQELAELGSLFDQPALALQFIGEGKSAKEFRAELMRQKAAKQENISTAVIAGADAAKPQEQQGKAKPWGEVLAAAGLKKGAK